MKLIDFLISEAKKGWEWPSSIVKAASTKGGRSVNFYFDYVSPPSLSNTLFSPQIFISSEVVTREQYEIALAARKEMIINKPDSDGWISWCGGECPVDGDVVVDVKFRAQGQADLDGDVADNFHWEHFSNGADVVAYRLHKSEHQKPEWDGEGLPPVGCECEALYDSGRGEWFLAKILAHDNGAVIGRWLEGDGIYSLLDYSLPHGSFRPIRSEADKKRDIIISKIEKAYIDCPHSDAVPQVIYEAIAEHIRID